jgi:hypothetical protein
MDHSVQQPMGNWILLKTTRLTLEMDPPGWDFKWDQDQSQHFDCSLHETVMSKRYSEHYQQNLSNNKYFSFNLLNERGVYHVTIDN